MLKDGMIYTGRTEDGREIGILPKMANRHGLIVGATGTGKTVTLKGLAESFSDLGVPVFLADVKGDLAGMIHPGIESDDMRARMEKFSLEGTGFQLHSYPTVFWDIYGKKGIQLRTTISEMGPLLLSRILSLNDIQSQILTVAFKVADDNSLLLIDTKDLKAMLNWLDDHKAELKDDYGNISSASIAAIIRSLTALEMDGGDIFFGETALDIKDLFTLDASGKGVIHILDSESLINHPALYSTFLLYLLSELFETLPEVGDQEKPKMVFFFDEAHLLFDGASKDLLSKIEQVVRLIRSKGIGIYFVTQSPSDVPDSILAQLGNKIQHGLRAYTPAEQKRVKAAAMAFRENPAFDTYETLLNLPTAQAVVSFLDEKGTPAVCEKVAILPPQSQMGPIEDAERDSRVKSSILYSKYATAVDPDSAYEFLQRKGLEEAAAAEQAAKQEAEEKQKAAEAAAAEKQRQKEEAAAEKQRQREEAAAEKQRLKEEAAREKAEEKERVQAANARKRAAKNVARSVVGSLGREAGRAVGKNFGQFGKNLGGNVGSSLARGLLNTLFKS